MPCSTNLKVNIMKKILFLIVLVIVLISLNWFNVLVAQDISSLNDGQLSQLYQDSHDAGEFIQQTNKDEIKSNLDSGLIPAQ